MSNIQLLKRRNYLEPPKIREHGRNVPHLDFTGVVLILLIMIINRIQKGYIYFLLVNHLVNYSIFYLKLYIFKNF